MRILGWMGLVGILIGGVACGEGDDKDAAGGQGAGAAGSGQSGAAGSGAAGSGGAAGSAGVGGGGDTLRDVSLAFTGFSADAGKLFYAVVANELGEPQFGAVAVRTTPGWQRPRMALLAPPRTESTSPGR